METMLDPDLVEMVRHLYPDAMAEYLVNGGPDPWEVMKEKLPEDVRKRLFEKYGTRDTN